MNSKLLILSREESRELDRCAIENLGVPGIVLMENAGRGVAEYLLTIYSKGTIIICCGKGNNGGDGFVIARHLDNANIPIKILLFAKPEELKGDALIQYNIILKSGISVLNCTNEDYLQKLQNAFKTTTWIIDALFGTGLMGPIKSPFAEVIQIINGSAIDVVSVDIPSGLDCDTGLPLGIAIKAKYTITFVALKKGFMNSSAKEYLGDVKMIDIGIPRILTETFN
jgi:NAD(P)H-hydrate epimerase